ncbi:MAG TPA: azurin [Rhodanobacteraceae bacterium]|nr:azurin [Rhodanobacteraceae bacterium]
MMNLKMPALVVAFTLLLSACGNNNPQSQAPNEPAPAGTAPSPASSAPMAGPMTAAPAATAPATGATSGAAAGTTAAAPGAMAGNGKPAATVSNCSTEIEANDAMQYNVGSIAVPSSCSNFKITLKHTGKLPVASMGHDVVITRQSDMQAVDQESAAAGLDNGYIKAGDSRIIAHTKLIGGGETTSVSFPVSKIKNGGPYVFFCSFPGHSALMHGTISVQ